MHFIIYAWNVKSSEWRVTFRDLRQGGPCIILAMKWYMMFHYIRLFVTYSSKIYNRDISSVNAKSICVINYTFCCTIIIIILWKVEWGCTDEITRELESTAIFNALLLTSDNLSVRRVEITKTELFSPGEKRVS